jgi:5-methylcytosine-specific restriction endonuclease McrA
LRLRRAQSSEFIETRTFWSRRYRIRVGRSRRQLDFGFSSPEFARLSAEIRRRGVVLVGADGPDKLWWVGGEELYWADGELQAGDVEVLLWDRKRRQRSRLRRLHDIRGRQAELERARRDRIPEAVRDFVWKRDEGRCVRCGVEDDLQFDHVIPVVRGGGSGVENIQILCGTCNRQKGAAIG